MNANLESIAEELFGKIRTRFPKIQLGNESGEVIANNKEIGSARFFEFDYVKEGVALGSVSIELSEDNGLVVMYSNDLTEGQNQLVVNEWYGFLKSLREFAKKRLLNFDTRDLVKTNLDKRDYGYLAKNNGEGAMTESKLWGTSKTSFQDMGEAKIIVKHTQPVNYDNPAGRTLHIESIFIENAQGERFKYPYKHLNGARALARHVAHGGTPYDALGEHVIGLSEEMSKLRFFKGYVSRQEQVSEAMGSVTDKVIERIEQVKKEIHQLQSEQHYRSFAESFKASEAKSIPEDIMNDWIDRLTVRSFNEALKDVFPYIYKLVDESGPVQELSAADLISATEIAQDPAESFESSISELDDFEAHLDSIVKEDDDLLSTDGTVQTAAIDKLNRLMAQELKAGPDGTNAVMTLKGLLDDDDFTELLSRVPAETDIRPIIKGYIETNHPDLADKLSFGGEATTASTPAEPPAPAPEAAPAEPAAAAPAETTPPAVPESIQVRESTARNIVEFVKSFYDREQGAFPKGETGVCIAAEKEFGEGAGNIAHKVIQRIHGMKQAKDGQSHQHNPELAKIKQLAGMKQEAQPAFDDDEDDNDDLTASMPAWAKQQLGQPGKAPAMKMPQQGMMDPNAMMKQQMGNMQAKMPNLDPTTMMKNLQAKVGGMQQQAKSNQTTGQNSFKVNGKPVSKAEYDQFMAQHPELTKLTPGKMPGGMDPNSELARIQNLAGVGGQQSADVQAIANAEAKKYGRTTPNADDMKAAKLLAKGRAGQGGQASMPAMGGIPKMPPGAPKPSWFPKASSVGGGDDW